MSEMEVTFRRGADIYIPTLARALHQASFHQGPDAHGFLMPIDSGQPIRSVDRPSLTVFIGNLEAVLRIPVHAPILVPDGLRHRPDLAIPHPLAVQLRDGHDPAGSGAHEDLVALVGELDRHDLAPDFDAFRSRSVENALSGNSLVTVSLGLALSMKMSAYSPQDTHDPGYTSLRL